ALPGPRLEQVDRGSSSGRRQRPRRPRRRPGVPGAAGRPSRQGAIDPRRTRTGRGTGCRSPRARLRRRCGSRSGRSRDYRLNPGRSPPVATGGLAALMKLILAIIKPDKLDAVKEALNKVEVFRLTMVDVLGFGRQKGQTEVYRGHELTVNMLRKVQLQIAVNEDFVEP